MVLSAGDCGHREAQVERRIEMTKIKDLPKHKRPREKLLERGAESLSDAGRLSGDTSLNSIVPTLIKLYVPGKMQSTDRKWFFSFLGFDTLKNIACT